MAYATVPVQGFAKGLNLRDQGDVLDPAEALDLLNVTFLERGAVRQRYGFSKLTSTALTNQPDSLFAFTTSAGAKRLLVGNGNRLDAFDTFPGATAANNTSPTASPHFFARFGGPAREAVYIANGTDQIRRYDTAGGFSSPAALSAVTGKFLAVQSPDNRLLVANFIGTTGASNPSTVQASAVGDPETFTLATDYVQLDPGDGEPIMGLVSGQGLTVAFKQSKLFVFYGNSTSSTGGAVFNFRRVDGAGLVASKAVCVGRDGIYFLTRNGVYRTTGGVPEQVSDVIDPFFTGGAAPTFLSDTINQAQIGLSAMHYHEERVYLSIPTGTSTACNRTLVFDPRYDWWTLYDWPATAFCSFRPTTNEELIFAASAATSPNDVGKHLCRHSSSDTADNMTTTRTGGTAISSRWRSGWLDFGDTDVKRVRETRIWAEGICEYRLTKDFLDAGSDDTLDFSSLNTALWGDGASWTDATWTTSRGTAPRLVRQARRGTVFSIEFSHNVLNETWAVHRLDFHLADKRVPSTTRTEVAA